MPFAFSRQFKFNNPTQPSNNRINPKANFIPSPTQLEESPQHKFQDRGSQIIPSCNAVGNGRSNEEIPFISYHEKAVYKYKRIKRPGYRYGNRFMIH
jgi:hypothetical protein